MMNAMLGWDSSPDEAFSARDDDYVEEYVDQEVDDYEEEEEEGYGEIDEGDEFGDEDLDDFEYYEDVYEDSRSIRRRHREWE